MKNRFTLILFAFLFLFCGTDVFAADFNGIISFRKIDGQDTTFYKYYVKDSKVRIEDVSPTGDLNGAMIINLDNAKIVMLSGTQKFYINVPVSTEKLSDVDLYVEKPKEKKKVAGKNCTLIKVENKINRHKYEYWINKGHYPFFNRMLRMLNREEGIAHVWVELDMKSDVFPLLGIEYSDSGEMITKLEVISIKEKELSDDLFIVPVDYQLLEKH